MLWLLTVVVLIGVPAALAWAFILDCLLEQIP